jgi:hypothetical protein
MKRHLLKNKIWAAGIFALGLISMIPTKDGTFFLFAMILTVGLWVSKENYILD